MVEIHERHTHIQSNNDGDNVKYKKDWHYSQYKPSIFYVRHTIVAEKGDVDVINDSK